MTRILPVRDDQWEIVAWLWQAFRHDLADVVQGLPYADGRYNHALLDQYPAADRAGYLAWSPHPNTGEDVPVGFALVSGLASEERTIDAFWIAPGARRDGLGSTLARHAIYAHSGPWAIAFQHDNLGAGGFWRRIAANAWGTAWSESVEPVPGKPDVPPDHWIRTAR